MKSKPNRELLGLGYEKKLRKMKQVPFEIEKYYHLYNRGNNKENIFLNEGNYAYFLKLVAKYLLPICEIYSYCLLPNHFHFIVKIKGVNELPEAFERAKLHQPFSNLFNTYSKAFNKQNNRRGSLFQEQLKRIEIKETKYLRSLIIYVNTNPSHHGLGDYKEYEHSSFKALIDKRETKIERDKVIELFDYLENMRDLFEIKKEQIEVIESLTFE